MEILIETNFMPLVHAPDLPAGVTKRILPMRERRDISFDPNAQMILSFGYDIGKAVMAGLIAKWLCDKLVKRPDNTYIKIERTEVALNEGEIERIIHTVIERKKNDR